ncbi:MAG: DNA polymerase III subunit gamma/tau, partial [Christensenellaceae bacterium]|nr:DNA polymerase III subunit gamma/tau [Christensenellaceae bacterium]
MAYKALYREFRPRRFGELKGQAAITAVLKNQVRMGEPAHAYLFSGPRGTGKTSTAKIMACALNCQDPKDGEPCLECENCRQALSDSMIDIIEMDAASNNGVDDARDIRD